MPPRADHAQRTQRRGRGGGSAPTRAQASVPPPGEVLTSTIKRKKKRLKGFRHCLCQDALCLELRKRPEMLPNKMVLLPTGDKGVFSTRAMVQALVTYRSGVATMRLRNAIALVIPDCKQ